MPFADAYRRQVALLIRVIPFVAEERAFALKGGTAINLFIRNMPRLSVDIDLAYLPVAPREESLAAIDAAMKRIAAAIRAGIPGSRVTEGTAEATVTKLFVQADNVRIKIEVTPVLRGTVYDAKVRQVADAVEDAFGFAETNLVSFADLYGGKIVAALDRQHPRDLFDIRDLLANEGIDDALRRAFIVYLISHDRPMFEVLTARPKDLSIEFARGFEGMTAETVSREALVDARAALVRTVVGGMPAAHRHFLISFERGEPDWDALGVPGAAELPAVKWRQRNLDLLEESRRDALVEALIKVLGE